MNSRIDTTNRFAQLKIVPVDGKKYSKRKANPKFELSNLKPKAFGKAVSGHDSKYDAESEF